MSKTIVVGVVALVLAASSWGCAPFGAPHNTMHPSRMGAMNAAGVSVGTVYTRQTSEPEDSPAEVSTTVVAVPTGEGWARFGLSAGQLEIRVSSSAASIGFRANLSSSESLAVAIIPAMSAGFWSATSETDDTGIADADNSVSAFTIAPTLSFLIMINRGAFYLGPRLGYQYALSSQEDSDGDEQDNRSSIFSFGTVLGTILAGGAFDTSIEAGAYGIFGSGELESGGATADTDTSGFLLVGSVGLSLGKPR